ncbi:MAG TPA: chemotaxis protein CheB [Bordetella sp.]|jgi:two-component system chemotaxis response regulator CheB|nr:chemotaxis protein CheB [Bordetella sp.]
MATPDTATSADGSRADGRITVLVCQPDAEVRRLLCSLLESDTRIRVAGSVADGRSALEFLRHTSPDVILMDNQMPGMDGFETTRRIMEDTPRPIVLCAAAGTVDHAIFRSLEAGAVACIERPDPASAPAVAAHLLQTVRLMSEVKVVRRWARATASRRAGEQPSGTGVGRRVVGIGASTGGPPVLQTLLAGLPQDFPMPVLVVQHIAKGFLAGMVEWLRHTSGLRVHIGAHGMLPQPGRVYLAPDDFHMSVGNQGQIVLGKDGGPDELRPSVAKLFRSLAESCGKDAIGVLLTGMGRDGAAELKLMKDRGAVTIAQDRDTSIVHGMPGAAIALGGATYVLPAERIAGTLVALAQPHFPKQRN